METYKSITKIRKAKGYTQSQIADKLQTTQQQYSKYETGAQEIPVRHIVKLCEIYEVTANKLIGIDTYMTEKENNNKFIKLYEEIEEIIKWAEYQEYISEEAAETIMRNIYTAKEEIENDPSQSEGKRDQT